MDVNKFKKLEEIGYIIKCVCGLCDQFRSGMHVWGTCKREEYKYTHLKHGNVRELSVHKFGSCKEFKESKTRINKLHAYRGLITGD